MYEEDRYINFRQIYLFFYTFYLLISKSTNYVPSTFNLLRSNKYRSMHLSIVTVAYATRWQSDISSIALEIEFLYPIFVIKDLNDFVKTIRLYSKNDLKIDGVLDSLLFQYSEIILLDTVIKF